MGVGLYIHIPFCEARCHFCAFYLQIYRHEKAQRYLNALAAEIRLHAKHGSLQGRKLDSVYFGGGTPTTLPPQDLATILHQVFDRFGMSPAPEVTVEAHPDTVTSDGLRILVDAGVNRISFGVQSLDDQELISIGRPGAPNVPAAAVEHARQAGFVDINLDLMYGLPRQTMESWLATLDEIVSLEPTHVSCYALTVEDRTRYARDLRRGVQMPPAPEVQNAMEDAAMLRLANAGLQRYEISNYCRPGYASRHNLRYWTGKDYLGLGPSAQSFLNGCRFGNVDDLGAYTRMVESEQLPIDEHEALTEIQRRREHIVFGLRLTEGIDGNADEHAGDPVWARSIRRLITDGLLEARSGRIRMTDKGRRYADSIAVELL